MLILISALHPDLLLQDRACDLSNHVPLEAAGNRSVPMAWPKRGPGTSRSWGQRRSAWRTLAGKETPAGCPRTSEPRLAIALLGGALAGSGPGTSPCIDGLSLVTGMVVPQRPAY
jgi:hypothetical protein